jgi:hypothetical protein
MEHALSALRDWESFYVIVGSSAAALTGLQFVVIALVAERRKSITPLEIAAFATPTVVHFGAVLLLSAILSAPWRAAADASGLVAACGVAGVIYAIAITARARSQTGYQPVLEDWLWHAALPLVAYGSLVGAAIALHRATAPALFVIGASTVLLLFIGIHNAWDTVTFVILDRPPGADAPDSAAAAPEKEHGE